MVKAKSFIEKFYVAFIGFLLYAPLLVLFVCSFNDSKSRTVWGGFTLHWYTDLFQNEEVLSAVRTSLLLTTLAALIATLIGTLACIGMTAMKLRFQKVMEGLSNIPLFLTHCILVVYSQTYEHDLAYTPLLLFQHPFFCTIRLIYDLYLLLFACI